MSKIIRSLTCLSLVSALCCQVIAEEPANKQTKIELAKGKLNLLSPKEWKQGKPRSRILQYEFSAPADAKEGDPTARITIMGAGGSIDANIERWYGQFTQPDGKSTKERAKVEKFEVDGQTVHWVDITGDFKETMGGGPFSGGKTVVRKEHRMLGAIIVTGDSGQYFIKMTGSAVLLKKFEEGFKKMLKELKFDD